MDDNGLKFEINATLFEQLTNVNLSVSPQQVINAPDQMKRSYAKVHQLFPPTLANPAEEALQNLANRNLAA